MEKILQYQQIKALNHTNHLIAIVKNHRVLCLTTLLPAFLWGWKKGKENSLSKVIKQLVNIGAVTFFSHIKKQLSIPQK